MCKDSHYICSYIIQNSSIFPTSSDAERTDFTIIVSRDKCSVELFESLNGIIQASTCDCTLELELVMYAQIAKTLNVLTTQA